MKKALLKISIVAALTLSTQLGFGKNSILPASIARSFDFFQPQMNRSCEVVRDYSQLLGLGSDENLKAYHLGLQTLFSTHYIPTEHHFMEAIQSHPFFAGTLSQEEGMELFKGGQQPFLVFEEKGAPSHFYVAHKKGLRHFTVHATPVDGRMFASLDNGNFCRYPSLEHFLKCTQS